jgi:alcohol dehydrogenase class IV
MTLAAYEALPSKVLFGKGARAQAGEGMAELGCRRVLILSTRSQEEVAGELQQLLGQAGVALFPRAAMHTPIEVTQEAMTLVEAQAVDGVLAVGGG